MLAKQKGPCKPENHTLTRQGRTLRVATLSLEVQLQGAIGQVRLRKKESRLHPPGSA